MATKILIIDDDPLVGDVYRSRLEQSGFQVEVMKDGQSGFYRIFEMHPDAILLDLLLPNISGLEILGKLRAQKAFRTIPIVVFTNSYDPNLIHQARMAGATEVFHKANLTCDQVIKTIMATLYPSVARQSTPFRQLEPSVNPAAIIPPNPL